MNKILFTGVLTAFTISLYSQGIVRGRITDENGETLTGATISLKSNPRIGTIADYDGNYSLNITGLSPENILIAFVGYETIEELVHPRDGEIIVRNFIMAPASIELKDVTITARAVRSRDVYMEQMKMKSAVSIDYISAETIKKTGDTQVNDAIKRVTGVSTIGSFITVRGLADRYIKTTINGSRIPTLDPFTNNIELDIFPTSLVDNIVINKTMSPDLPGDWAGAYLSIETRDYPDKFTVSFSTSFGYNPQTTFKKVLMSKRSSTDWLGFDNGYRDIAHPEFEEFPFLNSNPTPYQQFTVLGLGEYLHSLGINESHLAAPNINNIYYRLGLVELGILPPALFYDTEAIQNARIIFNNDFAPEAFGVINSETVNFGQSVPNNWKAYEWIALPDFSQEFSIGNQTKLFGKSLGYLFGLRYSSSIRYDPDAGNSYFGSAPGDIEASYINQLTQSINRWSLLLNLAYKINPNHSVAFMIMPNFSGVNNIRKGKGISIEFSEAEGMEYEIIQDIKFEERRQMIYQFKSIHFLPRTRTKIELHASFTDGVSSTPDLKRVKYGYDATAEIFRFGPAFNPQRIYMYLWEDIFDSRVSIEIPIWDKPGLTRRIRIGGAYQNNTKDFAQYRYVVEGVHLDKDLTSNDLGEYFSLDKFAVENGNLRRWYSIGEEPQNFNIGRCKVAAGFVMIDYGFSPSLRLVGGLRIEHTDIFGDIKEFYELDLPPNDPERDAAAIGELYANASEIRRVDYLPSANLVYKIFNYEFAQINLRLNYSFTLARPSLREVTPFPMYDWTLQRDVMGNYQLKTASVNNYDFRIESFFRSGDNLSISLFYKDFKNHIELVDPGWYTWDNAGDSWAYGIEMEGKKTFLRNFEFRANVTLVNSQTTLYLITTKAEKRPLFGQAPYIINGLLAYTANKPGISAALSYNLQGPRLILATRSQRTPDIYELPRHLLDLKISKSLGEHFNLGFKVRNIINSTYRKSYNYNDWMTDFEYYNYGTDFNISITYNN
jgi:hypothetical protein